MRIGAAVIVFILVMQYASSSYEASKVLNTIMRNHLRVKYTIDRVGWWRPAFLLGDPKFSWKITLKGEPDLIALVGGGEFFSMHRDKWEIERVSTMYPEDEVILAEMPGIKVFGADLLLDYGYMCAPFECAVRLVVAPDVAYVTVYNF